MFSYPISIAEHAPSLFGSFVGGLVATLTPCVYPLIPITLSIVGAGEEVPRYKAIVRATLYCLGIFFCYSLLGLLAVFSGSLFGSFWSLPSFRVALGIALCGYALVGLDLFPVKSRDGISQKAAQLGGNSALGAFLAGAVSGILAAPCTGPLLAAILTIAASTPNSIESITLLFGYAAGFSTPFFLLALSPRALGGAMPSSGSWLYGAKFIIGAALLSLGLYYLLDYKLDILKEAFSAFPISSLVAGLSILILFTFTGVASYLKEKVWLRAVSAVVCSLAILFLVTGSSHSIAAPSGNSDPLSASLERASKRKTAIMLEFTADWCVQCQELKQKVFNAAELSSVLQTVEHTVLDLSSISEEEKRIQQLYGVRGLPTVLFLCPSGAELPETRINEVISPAQFIARLSFAKQLLAQCN